jgi:hypothetical protein
VRDATQCQKVRYFLKRHGTIDPLTAWKKLGIYRLGARVYDLRKQGMPIVTTRKRTRGGAQVAVYRLA